MLDAAARAFLCFREGVAQAPEILRLLQRSGDDRIANDAVFARRREQISPSRSHARSLPRACDSSINAYQGCRSAKGSRTFGMKRSANSCARAAQNSNAVSDCPAWRSARRKSFSASSGDWSATMAVSRSAGIGKSFRQAAVMTPSVPSEPIKQIAEIVAGVVLFQTVAARARRARRPAPPRARASNCAHCRRRARPCPRRSSRARRRSWRCLPRQGSAETSGLLPGRRSALRAASRLLRRSSCRRPHRYRERSVSRASDSTISLPSGDGIWPPTRPVLPPCGTMPISCSLASARIRDTSSVDPGRSTTGVLPV